MGMWDRVERRIEGAFMGAFAKAFKSEVQPVEIASAIRRAMDDRASSLGKGRTIVPNLFTIELSPTDYEHLAGYEDELETELIAAAQEHAETQRYQPGGPLAVAFDSAEDLETGVFRVRPSTARRPGDAARRPPEDDNHEGTAAAHQEPVAPPAAGHQEQPSPPPAPRRVNPADRPWLDVDGERYPLMGAMTILGRDDTADIILDDPGISRRHSEIRVTTDGPHFVASIRDLNSTNGTFVNSERIGSQRLTEGDRITVGRTSFIYRAGRR